MRRLLLVAGVALLLTGCDTDQAAKVMDSMGQLRGAHAARGGANLDGGKGGDWQISRCDAGPDGSVVLSTSDAKVSLTVRKSAPKGATLRVPDGTVLTFSGDQCSILAKPQNDDERITVDCTAGRHEVLAGVTTLRCGG